jgi:hypothetical protein
VKSSKTPIVPFNIFTYAKYHYVKVFNDEITFQISIVDLGKSIKESDILSIEKE